MGLLTVLALHALLAVATGLAGRRLGRGALLVAAVGPLAALVVAGAATPSVLAGEVVEVSVPWAAGLGLTFDLRLDGLGLLFWLVIAGVGLLVMLYATRYFGRDRTDLGRFASMLVLFAGAMLLLTSADNVFALFVGWELTAITSYLLIGFEDDKPQARGSALQALLVTGAGGLALLGGLVILAAITGTTSLQGILAAAPSGTVASAALVLVLLGAMTKSAQAPFHFWLPGAMAAPTPVSAYLHSATMVKAGIYLVARFAPAFAPAVPWWQPTLIAIGGASLLLGGYRALKETDLKALLAYGTVSQLGFMLLLLGTGDPELVHAGLALVVAHALFKAALFMSVGVVDHQAHTRDIRRLTGVAKVMPVTAFAGGIAAASMAGVPPLLGFVSKEATILAALHTGLAGGVVTVLIVAGAVFTTAYSIRFVWGAFATKDADDLVDEELPDVPAPSLGFELPAAVLTVGTVVFGLWLAPVDELVNVAAASVAPAAAQFHLELWHGFGLSLALSGVALGGGALLYRWQDRLTPLRTMTARVPAMTAGYRRSLFGLNAVADRVTTVVQSGSLPVYLGTILFTLLVLPGALLVGGFTLPPDLVATDSALQLVVVAGVVLAALGTAVAGQRLTAVLLLGAVGFGVAVLFMIQGAPDLALTQLLIETLTLGIFVIVLRRLPSRFALPEWRLGRGLRIVLSVGVGTFVAGLALWASGVRTGGTRAEEFLSRALPDGGGKNVVNVILTDFRALDTLGEITVLVIVSIGIVSLVHGVARREDTETTEDAASDADTTSEATS